jgi:hypothetical protein
MIKNSINYINQRTYLWLTFVACIIAGAIFLYSNNYNKFLVLMAARRLHFYSLIPVATYIIFILEYKNCSYEKRHTFLRLISNLIQVPNFIISGISLNVLVNPVSLSHTQSAFFTNMFNDVMSTLFLTFMTYVVDTLIKRQCKEFIIKPKPTNYHVQTM